MPSGIVESSKQPESQPSPSQQAQQNARLTLVQRLQSMTGSLPNFMRELIRQQARLAAGTEAAAFTIEALQEGAFLAQADCSCS